MEALIAEFGGDGGGDGLEGVDRSTLIAGIAREVRSRGAPSVHTDAPDDAGETGGSLPELPELPELDGYDVVDVLGVGAMGAVYEAYQRSTGRRVAVKRMLEHTLRRASARRRFEREVELVARLQHPGIVPIIDSGVSDGNYFYAMEYVEGVTLDAQAQPGEWRVADAVGMIAKIARAVDYAHQRGVLHRDLKPQNILVDTRGEPRLLDFGLAKAFDPSRQTRVDVSLSMPGQLVGTVAYMSPEQARGEIDAVSTGSDVYALGVILYEMLTGRLPIDVNAPIHTALRRIESEEAPRPSSVRPSGISRDLDAVVLMALEKRAPRRYASAGEFAAELEAILGDRPVRARAAGAIERALRWRRRRPVASVAILAAVVVVVVGVTLSEANRRQRRASALTHLQLVLDAVDGASRGEAADSARSETRLDGYVQDFEAKLGAYPEFQALARQRSGKAYLEWKAYDKAHEQLTEALRLQESILGEDDAAVGDTLHLLGRTHYWLGEYDEAMVFYERARSVLTSAYGQNDPKVLETQSHIASTAQRLGRLVDAERAYWAVEEARASAPPINDIALARVRLNRASSLQEMGRYSDAMALLVDAEAVLASNPNAKAAHHARAMHSLGASHLRLGHLGEASRLLGAAYEAKRDGYGSGINDDMASTLIQLAELALAQERTDDAVGLAEQAIEVLRAKFPDGHRIIGEARLTLGWIRGARGEWEEAAGEHQRARDEFARSVGPGRQLTAEAESAAILFRMFAGLGDEGVGRLGELLAQVRRDRVAEQVGVRRVSELIRRAAELPSQSARRESLLELVGG